MSKRNAFVPKRIVVAVAFALFAPGATHFAHAGAGWGDSVLFDGSPIKRPTYFAHSPSGMRDASACFDPATGQAIGPVPGGACDSGTPLAKFKDVLPLLGLPGGTGNYISVAAPDTTTYPGTHYYELVVMESKSIQMHSDLPPTTLRTYVQVDPVATDSAGASSSSPVTYLGLTFNSQARPLSNSDGSPVMISRPDGAGGFVQRQAYGWDKPTYLGSTIVALRGTPTRIKLYNGLPVGHGVTNPDGSFTRNGDLPIPVDRSNPGAGDGPVSLNSTRDVLASSAVLGPYDPAGQTASATFPYYHIDPAVPPVAVENFLQHTQNRAELHLHGGDNPWQSDGHPHQWIAPAADELKCAEPGNPYLGHPEYCRGPIAYNVPDMPDPGPGAVTYFWPNGQSGRLMMFHDHATGLTRLNAYMGEAAGYLLADADELTAITNVLSATNGSAVLLDAAGIPLVFQDKTFVPKDIAQQDARWDTVHWGSYGDLWYPHVYEPNQDPDSIDGTNPVGRWDWGAYFWPVFPSLYAMPTGVWGDETLTPEAWMDTPVVNGAAYPTLTVDPKTYRFRMLSVANDRFFNLGLYVAANKSTPVDGITGLPLTDTALATNGIVSYSQLCDGSAPVATGNCTEVSMVPFDTSRAANPALVQFPTTGGPNDTGWGTPDSRFGGVPDPATKGPDIVLIGNEAGLLAKPQAIPSTITNYEYNRRSVTVMNILERGLWLATAERADVLIDFSQYAGKTLILYNDSPAPVPAGDPRLDFFTGMGDMTPFGGAPNPLPGFGPNTRTVMQIHVRSVAEGGVQGNPLDTNALAASMGTVYAATQPKPVVPQLAYNAAFPGLTSTDTLARIYTGSIYLNRYQPLSFTTPVDMNYTPAPVCNSIASCNTALTTIRNTQDPALPATMKGLKHVAAGSAVTAYVENKAIQELFDPDFGRMNATLGVELPFTSALVQTTIPLAYVDPATETIRDGETQFWKITHNGVDTHPVHFHMLNVQVVNRVGWDGTLKPPLADEIGWKETVRMHPLEDIIVAVRAKTNPMPFGLPYSYRMDAPHLPVGATHGFTQVDPATGNPAVRSNQLENYKYEYVWHCHILGHEENDFMRPFILDPGVTLSPVPTGVTAIAGGGTVMVTWNDPSPVNLPTDTQTYNQANAAIMEGAAVNTNEIGFRVERSLNGQPYVAVGTPRAANAITNATNTLANATSFIDNSAVGPAGAVAPDSVSASLNSATSVTVNWTLPAGTQNPRGFNVLRSDNGGAFAPVGTALLGTERSFTDTTVQPGTTYSYQIEAVASDNVYTYRVAAVNAAGDQFSSNTSSVSVAGTPSTAVSVASAPVTTPVLVVLQAPTGLTAQLANLVAGPDDVLLQWTDNSTNESGYQVERCSVGACGSTSTNWAAVATLPANSSSYVHASALTNGTNYRYRVAALNGAVVGPLSNTASMNLGVVPAAPSNLAGVSGAAGAPVTVELAWTDNANNNASFEIQQCAGRLVTCAVGSPNNRWNNVSTTVGANATAFSAGGLVAGNAYRFRIRAVNPAGPSGWNYTPNMVAAQ